jgi:RNA polymerase sigma-70 factor (ECF subfamily)
MVGQAATGTSIGGQGIQDNRAFETFFDANYVVLARALFLLTGDPAESEDLVQEAMARAFERWEEIGRMASPAGYVYRTAANLHHRRALRRAVFARLSLKLVEEEKDVLSTALNRVDVGRALVRVPRRLREALILVDWLEMNAGEAAEILGIAATSVRSRVSRGRAALRAQLEERDE